MPDTQSQDWYTRTGITKEDLLAGLDDLLQHEYNCYRAVDCYPDPESGYQMKPERQFVSERHLGHGTVVARKLNSADEAFEAFDWDLDEDDADDQRSQRRRIGQYEVSSLRGCLRLSSRGRKVTASGTTWTSSSRGINATALWMMRQEQYDAEERMLTAAGNTDGLARLRRMRGK